MSHWKRCIQLGGNRKWVVWWTKHRFGLFELIIPNGLSKIMQRICNLVFHILWELRIKVFKNYEDKAKRPLLTFFFHVPYMPYSDVMFPSQRAPRALLDPNKDFMFIMEWYKLHKVRRKSARNSLRSKAQTLHVWNNYSKLALKNYIPFET